MKVLIVEDEIIVSTALSFVLKNEGIDVCGVAPSSVEAIELARENKPDIIIMDTTLEDGDGITTTKKIREFLDTKFIFCTGADQQTLNEIDKLNPLTIIRKPFSMDRLVKIIKNYSSNNTNLANSPSSSTSVNLPFLSHLNNSFPK